MNETGKLFLKMTQCGNMEDSDQDKGILQPAIAAFEDRKLNDILGLDGENDFVVYMATAGKL